MFPVAAFNRIENRWLRPPENRCQRGSFQLVRAFVAFQVGLDPEQGGVGTLPESRINHPPHECLICQSGSLEQLSQGRKCLRNGLVVVDGPGRLEEDKLVLIFKKRLH